MGRRAVPVRQETFTTDRGRIDEANLTLQEEMAKILGSLDEKLQLGLSQFDSEEGAGDIESLRTYSTLGEGAFKEASRLQGLSVDGEDPLTAAQIGDRFLDRPDIQFQQEQGQRAVENSAAARGLLGSGAVMKELNRFGQGVASQALSSKQDELARLAGLGANAAAQAANISQGTAQAKAGLVSSLGQTGAGLAASAAGQRQSSLANAATQNKTLFGFESDRRGTFGGSATSFTLGK